MRPSLARAAFEVLESRRLLASTVTGFAFYDRNASGVYESGTDFPLQGATAYLDLNDNGALDTGEPSATSAGAGGFSIVSNQVGAVRVRVAFAAAYTASAPAAGYADVVAIENDTVFAGSFGAWTTGAISGTAYYDGDADGIIESGDQPMLGATVYADLNLNGTRDADEPFSTTSLNNQITWRLDLKPGTYTLRAQLPNGAIQSIPGGDGSLTHTITAGMISLGNMFGGYTTGRAGGYTFDDRNANGVREANEAYLPGRTVYVDLNQNGQLDTGEPSKVTEPANASFPGTFSFDLYPGTYQIRHLVPTGWERTLPTEASPMTVTITGGMGNLPAGLGSRELGKVTGTIFNDLDADGMKDAGEGPFPSSPIPWVWLDLDNDSAREAGEPQVQPNVFTGAFELHAPAGQYTLRVERQSASWVHSPGSASRSVTIGDYGWVTPSGDYGLYIGGTVSGIVFNDVDGDGVWDAGESSVGNRTVYVDLNKNGVLDSGEPSKVATVNGYTISGVPAGLQQVRQVVPADWFQTAPANDEPHSVDVAPNQTISNLRFGTRYDYATLYGNLFEDLNGNGVRDTGEGPLGGFTGYIDGNNNGFLDAGEASAVSNSAGIFRIDQVTAGTHVLRVVGQANWGQTAPAAGAGRTVTVAAGQSDRTSEFGFYYDYNSISGNVFNDADGDGTRDTGEVGLVGKRVYLDLDNDGSWDGPVPFGTLEPSVLTDGSGNFTFSGLLNGTYVVRQVLDSGWRQTQPGDNVGRTVTVLRGQNATGTNFGATSLPSNGYIAGFIYDDADGDGVRDAGETTYLGRTVWLDTDNDGQLDAGERSTTSPAGDSFMFFDVPPGTYNVRASVPAGWRQTSPANNAAYVYSVAPGQSGAIFIGQTRELGVIDGVIFYDSNADGELANESRAQGRTVFVDTNNNGVFNAGEPTAISDSIGHYQFHLAPGTYTIRLMPQTNLVQTRPTGNAGVSVTAVASQARNAPNMALYDAVPISGVVFNDTNGNGTRESGEAAIAGRRVYIDRDGSNTYDAGEITAVSDASGNYTLQAPGSAVHFVRQEIPAGWVQTAPLNPQFTVGSAPLTINFGNRLNPQSPFNAAPFVIGDTPVTIEAEHYDRGGEGVAYHDTDTSNGGAEIRTGEGVDLKLVSGNNYRINNTFAGEWFEYTIDITRSDDYHIEYRVGSKGSNGRFRVERFDPITGGWTNEIGGGVIPNTGSNSSWVTLKHTKFLPAGLHVWRFTIEQDSTYGSAGNFDWFRITNANAQEPPPPPPPGDMVTLDNTIAAYVRGGASANTNFGNDAQLVVKTSGSEGNRREAYLKFDVSSLPADPSDIAEVKLRLSGRLSNSGGGVDVAAFGSGNTSWSETAITWNTKPPTSGSALATRTVTGTSSAWYEWDVTSYVKAARQNGQSSVTLVLRAANTTDAQALFNSDDAAGDRPQLVATTSGDTTTPPQQALVVSHAQSGASVPENGFEPVTVALATAPASNVVVTITKQGGGDADLTADKTTLTFTPANWNVPQQVNFSAANDADSVNGQAIFSFAASGLSTVNVTAVEVDDDGVAGEPTTYLADAATYVRGGDSANLNFGTASDLVVKKASASSTRETYIRFDLSTVSAVTSATLRLNARLSDSTSDSVLTEIFSASNTTWTEGGLTWNNKPAAGATVRGSVNVVGMSSQWYEIDLTGFIQSEIAAGRKVITLVLKNPNRTEAQTWIASDETANGPQLVVE